MEENIITQTQIAFHNLNGLVNGISMDGRITKSEFDAMKSWCQTHDGLCEEEPFLTFHEEVRNIIKTGQLGSEEIFEIKKVLDKYAPKFEESDPSKASLHFLQGICYGIMADGDINKYELNLLKKWLDDHEQLKDTYPFNEIAEHVANAISHGKLDQENYLSLQKYFREFLKIE